MIEEVLRIGDEVTLTIPEENRQWGYNPCPDGTNATVLGFSETYYGRIGNLGFKPGVYVNRYWVKLHMQDGREHTEFIARLELADKNEYERRVTEFSKAQQEGPRDFHDNKEFIRELPETPFWEGDKVHVNARLALTVVTGEMPPDYDPDIFTIVGIEFYRLNQKTKIGTKYPAYNISDKLGSGWHTSANEDDMKLIKRGNVWKFYHGEPLQFADIREEADLFMMLGRYKEVRNPKTGYYSWTKEEVLEAIKNGTVHTFSLGRGIFEFIWDPPTRISAYEFMDVNLGERVRQATIKGFNLQPV